MTRPPPATTETPPERTALAWQRTGLSVLAIAALLGHGAARSGRPILLVVAGTVALLGLGVLGGLAPARRRQLHRMPTGGVDAVAPHLVAAVTTVVALVGLASAGAALTLR